MAGVFTELAVLGSGKASRHQRGIARWVGELFSGRPSRNRGVQKENRGGLEQGLSRRRNSAQGGV